MSPNDLKIVQTINYYGKHEDEIKNLVYNIIRKKGFANILNSKNLLEKLNLPRKDLDENQLKTLLYYDYKDDRYPCFNGIIYDITLKNIIISSVASHSYVVKLILATLFIAFIVSYILYKTIFFIIASLLLLALYIIVLYISGSYMNTNLKH